MKYSEFVEMYEKLAKAPGRLDKTTILAEFLKALKARGKAKWIYLLKGKVVADYDSRESGISRQITIKAIAHSYGAKEADVVKRVNKVGDLGEVAEEFASKRRQTSLFSSHLTAEKVFDEMFKLMEITGKGTVENKLNIISGLLGSASGKEAKYIIRTLLNDLRIGVSDSTIIDAIGEAFFKDNKKEMSEKIEKAYDMSNDFAVIFEAAEHGEKGFEKIGITPGKPMNVMLAVKVKSIEEAFEVCGKPAAIEQKYDGFRMVINKVNGKVSLFTRRLENVTHQFPDVVEAIKKHVKGESFVLDSEVVGYDSKSGKYLPFQAISQRIKRKYDIEKIIKTLPVEVNVFDVLYHNGESFVDSPFRERRKVVEKIIETKKFVIRPAVQIITDSEEKAMKFYKDALKIGEEGIMMKNLEAPYKQGRKVGFMIKLKPEVRDLDLVIVGAEYGTGKRGGWFTSFVVACRHGDKFLEVGKVSSGLKELEEQGTTYNAMTKLLKPLVISSETNAVKVKPKIVVSVTYQEIQKSPSYDSGYALRFPRITAYRPDRSVRDINSINDIEREVVRTKRK